MRASLARRAGSKLKHLARVAASGVFDGERLPAALNLQARLALSVAGNVPADQFIAVAQPGAGGFGAGNDAVDALLLQRAAAVEAQLVLVDGLNIAGERRREAVGRNVDAGSRDDVPVEFIRKPGAERLRADLAQRGICQLESARARLRQQRAEECVDAVFRPVLAGQVLPAQSEQQAALVGDLADGVALGPIA